MKQGQRVRITWSGRIGTVVSIDSKRHAGIRVLLDGEAVNWGFNRNELIVID